MDCKEGCASRKTLREVGTVDSSLRDSNIVQHADLANHGEKNLRKGAVVARQKSTWTSGIQGARIVQAARWRG